MMARYAYKDVCFRTPEHIFKKFIEEHKRDHDQDSNYDGDYWITTGMWIDELESKIKELEAREEKERKLDEAWKSQFN